MPTEEPSFGAHHFGSAALGDVRRTRRLVQLADAFVEQPDGSLPQKCGSEAQYQGLLGLLGRPEVTHGSVLEPHLQRTRERIAARTAAVTLVIGDITELDFTSRTALRDQLGPIGNGGGFGYECFNLLAVDPERRQVLGLVHQFLFRRRRRKMSRTRIATLPVEQRQSGLWARAATGCPVAPAGGRVVRVFDREGDTHEAVRAPGEYLIRSRTNRCIRRGAEPGAEAGKLHTYLRSLPAAGFRELTVPATAGRAGRVARCGVAFATVGLGDSRGRHPVAPAWAVRVWELDPPDGVEPVEWLLLTNVSVAGLVDAQERVDWYECRWVVEEYHKGLKTGVRIESAQLTDRDRLEPLLGLLSVVALQLLWVRDAARDPGTADQPADRVLDPVLVTLAVHSRTGVKVRGPVVTVAEFYHMVARLGGYRGNVRKKAPGWQTLWHGWNRLQLMAQGARAALEIVTCDHS